MVLAYLRDKKIVGVTAPHEGAGVSRVAEMLASLSARTGERTLLVRFSRPLSEYNGEARHVWLTDSRPGPFVRRGRSYDLLQAWLAGERAFTNSRQLRAVLDSDLADYGAIIVDLPDLEPSDSGRGSDPLIPAGACDGVIVVCVKDRTTMDEVSRTIETLQVAAVPIVGTLLNDVGQIDFLSEAFVHHTVEDEEPAGIAGESSTVRPSAPARVSSASA